MALAEGTASDFSELVHASRQAAAGALAGGLIAASGRAHTAEEAKAVFDEVYWTLYPSPTDGSYNSWQSAKQARAAQDYHKNEYEQ
ncbi:hypothetical protein [Lichenibacterium dinghuense]|uniref:hypothetical protein n=1 Tax=Lichenibacterium dinghuense TaxID=2895977 RepID=UPI001F2A9F75|nr:hypothetical protein [Lichenibacterium sp. 6Y81]